MGDISDFTLISIQDVTVIDDGSIMVLDCSSCVSVFASITADDGDDDQPSDDHFYNRSVSRVLRTFQVAPGSRAITFH